MVGQRRVLAVSIAIVLIVLGGGISGATLHGSVLGSASAASTTASSAASPAVGPSAVPSHAAVSSTTSKPAAPIADVAANSSIGARAIAASRAAGVPLRDVFLPAADTFSGTRSVGPDGIVQPTYTSAPAPIGVAYFGTYNNSGTPAATVTNTTSVEGVLSDYNLTPLSVDSGAPDYYGAQLNAVLTNVDLYGTYGYQFWTQNVLEYSEFGQQFQLLDNVWNFSSNTTTLSYNAIANHSVNGTQVGDEYYYAVGPLFTIGVPFTVALFLNTAVMPNGNQVVYFNYSVENDSLYYSGTYDFVEFNSTGGGIHAPADVAQFQANGTGYNPTGYLPDDWEMVLGGPGGGSNADFLTADADISLNYWTGSEYVAVPSAMNFGGDTGETSIGATEGYFNYTQDQYAWVESGPTWPEGLWNISGGYGPGYTYVDVLVEPANAFLFVAPGLQAITYSDEVNFSWAPQYADGYSVFYFPGSVEFVSAVAVLANFEPAVYYLATNDTPTTVDLNFDPYFGVYTPLWANNNDEYQNITLDGYHLANDVYGILGATPILDFQWFGLVNDFFFQVFPGVFIQNVSGEETEVLIQGVTSLTATIPSWQSAFPTKLGYPTTNQLMDYFYEDTEIAITGSTFSGFWYTDGYFGSEVSQANVVLWNVTYSTIQNNTFATGGNALFLYGGYYNVIYNNTFTESFPTVIGNEFTIAGLVYGTTGITEEDYYDLVVNNIFLTYWTAVNPAFNPYTSTFTEDFWGFFYETWNLTPTTFYGPNIIGGPEWAGNYWWNYGEAYDPFGQPYDAEGEMYWSVDYEPLWPTALYTVTFQESGLPTDTFWYVEVYDPFGGGWVYNGTYGTFVNLTWPNGTYEFYGYSDVYQMISTNIFYVEGHNLVVDVEFGLSVQLQLVESGLPTGAEWSAESYSTVTGNYYFNTSVGHLLNLTVVNGTTDWYAYDAYLGDQEYAAYPADYGTVAVSGLTVVDVAYVPVYALNFSVSGLPSNTVWTIVVYGGSFGDYGYFAEGSYFNFSALLEGSYTWTIYATGYTASPANGSVVLHGDRAIAVSFAATRSVTFTETGLGAGGAWTVWFTQGSSTVAVSGTGATIVVAAIAGAYNYTIRADGYSAAPGTGSGTLGSNATISVALSKNSAPSTTFLGIAPMPWGLIAFAFIALAIIALALAALFRGRSKKPAEMTPYSQAPAGAAGGAAAGGSPPPAGGTPPAWQEDTGGSPPPK